MFAVASLFTTGGASTYPATRLTAVKHEYDLMSDTKKSPFFWPCGHASNADEPFRQVRSLPAWSNRWQAVFE
jgi:hypothetical protein